MSQTSLRELFAAMDEPIELPPERRSTSADALRLQLAVRGWARPRALIGEDTEAALATLAPEVETAAALQPGKWFLSVPARIQALAAADDPALLAACTAKPVDDADDPVNRAFRVALNPLSAPLPDLDQPTLRSLVNVNAWLGERWRQPYGPEQINAAIAAKSLSADLRQMTALPLVGAVHEQALIDLERFVGKPADNWLSYVYIHGAGGSGKTTLLAFLQRKLSESLDPAAIARIDFDEPAIDAGRLVTLNLALFEQLASALPQVGLTIAEVLPVLRRTASALRTAQYAGNLDWAQAASSPQQSLVQQKVAQESVADQSSILYNLLSPETLGGPLVIVLDTAELVLSDNDRAAAGIVAWLQFLRTEARASDIRLIVAGRDPPPDGSGIGGRDLLARLGAIGARADATLALAELTPAESASLLKNCDVKDAGLREAAAQAIPGNPLLLRITADALKAGDADVIAAVEAAQIGESSARTYLARRIVAHVTDPAARPYAIAAMVTPILSKAMLERAIMPLVDGGAPEAKRVERVFRSLGATAWFGRVALDGKSIALARDLRRFVHTLVEAVPDDFALHRRLHEALYVFHTGRRTAQDRALAIYHAAMLGWPRPAPSRGPTLDALRALFDYLPPELKDRIRALEPPPVDYALEAAPFRGEIAGVEAPISSESDAEWVLYLEGNSTRPGQLQQLVDDDHAAEALKLYRERPTREPGRPPTYVIQALADLGCWDTGEIDLEALIEELFGEIVERNARQLQPDTVSRLYWTTRFALFVDPGQISPKLIELLKFANLKLRGPGLTMLPALVAMVEAITGQRLMDERLFTGIGGHEVEGRIHLARRTRLSGDLPVAQFAVPQRDWFARLERSNRLVPRSNLHWAQKSLDALHGRPLATVNQTFAEMRRSTFVEWNGEDMPGGILLLRGQTVELLRPLRETLADLHAGGEADAVERIVADTLAAMTILPAELEPETFFKRLGENPRGWLTGFVGFADRARLLRGLCERIVAAAPAGEAGLRAVRVARAFIAWDVALCAGGSSEWGAADQAGETAA